MASEIVIQGFAGLAHVFEKAPNLAFERLGAAMYEAELLIEALAKEKTPVFTGLLRDSIAAKKPVVENMGLIGVVGSPIKYAIAVELGSAPHFPPIAPLQEWAFRKLKGNQKLSKKKARQTNADAKDFAMKIAWKIKARGTKGHFMMTNAFKAATGQVNGILNRALKQLEKDFKGA